MGDERLTKWTKWAELQVQRPRYEKFGNLDLLSAVMTLPTSAAERDAAVLGIAQMLKLNKTLQKIRYAPRAVQTSVVLFSNTLISLSVTQSESRSDTER
jgi:hypothetical protein